MSFPRIVALLAGGGLVLAACAGVAGEGSAPDTAAIAPPVPGGADPLRPPDVDLSVHSVPLEDVYFDTFDGGSVRLADSTAELRARLLDAIPPIDRPTYGDVSAGEWLEPGDLVLGYVAGSQPYAYPFKILNFHEIVNDVLDDRPVLISYCPLCRSAIVYDRRLGGEVLTFSNTSALYESDLVMVDRNSGSYWWQVAGTAIVGPLTGTSLEPLPSVVATWADWKSQHPDTQVLTRETGYTRPYERDAFAGYADFIDSGSFAFPVGESAADARLRPSALVVGVVIDGIVGAYPVEGAVEPINDVVGDEPIVVFPGDGGAAVFSSVVGGESLVFDHDGEDFVDSTGSMWSRDGVALSGGFEGASLSPIPSRTTFWFALVAAFPEVELHAG